MAHHDQDPQLSGVDDERVTMAVLLDALRAATSALTSEKVDHVVIGDLAIAHHVGESCSTRVLELLIGPEDSRCAPKALLAAGFDRGEGEDLLEDADGVRVELHAGLVDPEAGALLTATKADVHGVTVAVARPEYLIWSCLHSEEPHDLEGAERLVERRVLPFHQLATWIRSRASKRELAHLGAIAARVRGRIEQRWRG